MSLIIDHVSKIYKTGEIETKALDGISLTIDEGVFAVIVGPSGSGKSTLLHVISGLDTVTKGKITYQDECISEYTQEEMTAFRRKHLGFVFQQYNLLQNLTALENVQMGADLGENSFDPKKVLKDVGLADQWYKYPYQMSGGEQQRVSVARSVAKNPRLLFCDEPTGSLDEKTAVHVLQVIENLHKDLNITILLITHNTSIAGMADVVIRMNSGRIEEVKTNKKKVSAHEVHW